MGHTFDRSYGIQRLDSIVKRPERRFAYHSQQPIKPVLKNPVAGPLAGNGEGHAEGDDLGAMVG